MFQVPQRTEWNTSVSGLCWRCVEQKHKYHKEKHRNYVTG